MKPPGEPAAVALVLDDAFLAHDTGEGHPESPDRLRAVRRTFDGQRLSEKCLRLAPRPATDDELHLCHTPEYVALVQRETASGARVLSTGDTAIGPRTLEVARLAAGSAMEAAAAVCDGRARRAFCVVRPPGHHATPSRGMGFCLFNNAALAARFAQRHCGISRVAIFDWDVHHGNGTQDIFEADPSVFFCSTHRSPWYPGTGDAAETGTGDARGTTLNVPLPAGAGMDEIGGALRDRFLPAMEEFRPELLVISAGFDSREGDPLGGFRLTDADFAALTGMLAACAYRFAGGRVVSVLEGGYRPEGLASAAAAHLQALGRW